tara:strand:+ start:613 stop:825 length:213 start_codon:yes stop_codon:yes gene_type:complete
MQSQQNYKKIIKRKILVLLLFICVCQSVSTHAQKEYVVVLDAGHGGHDPGNLGSGYRGEKYCFKSGFKSW